MNCRIDLSWIPYSKSETAFGSKCDRICRKGFGIYFRLLFLGEEHIDIKPYSAARENRSKIIKNFISPDSSSPGFSGSAKGLRTCQQRKFHFPLLPFSRWVRVIAPGVDHEHAWELKRKETDLLLQIPSFDLVGIDLFAVGVHRRGFQCSDDGVFNLGDGVAHILTHEG